MVLIMFIRYLSHVLNSTFFIISLMFEELCIRKDV